MVRELLCFDLLHCIKANDSSRRLGEQSGGARDGGVNTGANTGTHVPKRNILSFVHNLKGILTIVCFLKL